MPGTDPHLLDPQPSVQVGDVDPLIGTELGGFKVVKLLAAGGMGLVYEAMHPAIGRRAAVKVLKPEVAADAEWTKRFLAEARALGAIKHRNLIEILNFGKTPDGREFLMMEFLDGEPLDAYIRRLGSLAPAVALGIVDQVLNGLAEAHKKGVVHRDLKPANVYLLREHNGELLVKVLDFGLARQEPISLVDGTLNLAKRDDGASLLAGTPEYIAPEQAQGKKVDGSADLYSLGIMLYEMLSGQLPFESESVTALLQKHLSERPPKLSSVMNSVPEGIEEFVESLLQKEPQNRPVSADVARATVQRLLKRLAQDSTAVRVAVPVEQSSKHAETMRIERPKAPSGTDKALDAAFPERKRRGPIIAALAVLVLLLLAGIGWTSLGKAEQSTRTADPVVEAPPVEPVAVKPAEPEPKPEPTPTPVAVAEPVKPTEVAPTPEPDLTPVKPIKSPPVQVTKTLKTKVTLEMAECDPTPEWKQTLQLNVSDMGKLERVQKDSALYDAWETDGRKVVQAVTAATTVSECTAAQALYRKLERKMGL